MTQPIRSESGRVVPLTVSMTGPTAVGKSQLTKLTAALLSDAVASRVPADYFLVPRPDDVPIGDFLRRPIAWDWPLLDRLLAQPLGDRGDHARRRLRHVLSPFGHGWLAGGGPSGHAGRCDGA